MTDDTALTDELARLTAQHALDRAEIERLEKLRAEMQGELVKLRSTERALERWHDEHGKNAELAADLARWMPVIEAAKEWNANERAIDALCDAGERIPVRLRQLDWKLVCALRETIDTALAEKENDRE